jgi:hypothetical protein
VRDGRAIPHGAAVKGQEWWPNLLFQPIRSEALVGMCHSMRGAGGRVEAIVMLASLKASVMISADDLALLQREQFRHDQRNHSDILCLPKPDRLKHYGLHFAKYVGRLARGSAEAKPIDRTVTDTALVGLSAANTLHQRLDRCPLTGRLADIQIDPVRRPLADAADRFADACEKIGHLEDFLSIARAANEDILNWFLAIAAERQLDLKAAIKARRRELADKQFYVTD